MEAFGLHQRTQEFEKGAHEMKMKLKEGWWSGIIALALLTVPAQAADIAVDNQLQFKPIEEFTFSGPYIGLGIGAGMRNHEIDIDVLGIDGIGAGIGPYAEIFLGYQHEFQNGWLLGVEGAIMYDFEIETTANLGPLGLEAQHENNLAYQAGIKVGRTVTERALLYVLPYWRWMTMDVSVSTPGGSANFSQDYDGPGAQIGLDVLATQNVVVSTYFRGTFYGEESWGVPGLNVDTHELEGGLRVAFKSNPLFGN